MLFTTRLSPLLGQVEDQGEDNTELLTLGSNEESSRASTPLEKPRRGRLPRKLSQNFRFSRQDSPAILVSDFGSEDGRRNDYDPSPLGRDVEYPHDADTEYPLISPSQQKNLRREFRRRKQLWELLIKGFIGWLCTCFLIGMIYLILTHFSKKQVMSDGKKREFNTVITALSLALGFNLAASLKAMAVDMRWWILSRRRRSLREVDLILNCDSMMNLLKLMYIAPRPRVILACGLWLSLNLAAQVGVAILGLTYSIDSGTGAALTNHGNVSSSDMRFFYPNGHNRTTRNPSNNSQKYTANIYGNTALSYKSKDLRHKGVHLPRHGTTWVADTADYFEGEDFWEYVFLDSNPGSGSSAISMYTNRTIRATGNCSCSMATGLEESNGAGITKFQHKTTYLGGATCGPRCAKIDALEVASLTETWIYKCNITISTPKNTANNTYEYVSDSMAKIAAGAIALQPYGSQQTYPAEATYGIPKRGNNAAMAKLISRFAIGSIIGAAYNNPTNQKLGQQPQQGVMLDIDKRLYLILILLFTAGTQGVLFILSALLANRVVVRDNTHLATARLLRPLMERLDRSGSMANGKDISEALGHDVAGSHGKHLEVIYSVKHPGKGCLHHLDLGEQKALRSGFPEGTYE